MTDAEKSLLKATADTVIAMAQNPVAVTPVDTLMRARIAAELPGRQERADHAAMAQQIEAQKLLITQYRNALDGAERTIASLTAALADERAAYRKLLHAAAHPPAIGEAQPDAIPARSLTMTWGGGLPWAQW